MYKRDIVGIILEERKENSVMLQKVLTEWGCMIKTRLGLHDGVLDSCTPVGLVVLEVVGEEEKMEGLVRKLNLLNGVRAQRMTLRLP